jgi:hypothetical protein
LVEYRPSWPKFDPVGFFCAVLGEIRLILENLDDIQPKSVAEVQLRAYDRF